MEINIEQENPRFRVAVRSDIGGRTEQQDQAFYYQDASGMTAAVCDGMGGLPNGAQASRLAVGAVERMVRRSARQGRPAAFLRDLIREADLAVARSGEAAGGGTTIVIAAVWGDTLYWASVGDSRLYLFRTGELVRATRDHNYFLRLDELLANGEIGRADYLREAVRGEALISYVGMDGVMVYDLTQTGFPLQAGDRILLVTDGIYRAVSDEDIRAVLADGGSAEEEADRLLERVRSGMETSRRDNASLVLIQIMEGEAK